jgi:hypothetical protein
MSSDSKEAEARTIGIKWPWVPHIDAIGSNVMPARTDVTKETEHTRQTIIRCLQSLVHTFSGLNMLTSSDTKASVLMPVELRLVPEGLASALRAIRTIQKGIPQAQAHTMCVISSCLGSTSLASGIAVSSGGVCLSTLAVATVLHFRLARSSRIQVGGNKISL